MKTVARDVDLMLVVGSVNSSNSNRLREVAENSGATAHLVNCIDDLKSEWFQGDEKVGITAGASTPEDIVQKVISWLHEHYDINETRDVVTVEETEHFSLPQIG